MMVDLGFQLLQMTLVILIAPLLTGFVRTTKARLARRHGAAIIQPYRDLVRLARKEVIVADSASWLFRVTPYIVLASTWVAAALIPTFATGLLFSWSADLIAIIALLGVGGFSGARWPRRRDELRRPRLEPRVAVRRARRTRHDRDRLHARLVAGSTQLSTVAAFMTSRRRGPQGVARHGAGRLHYRGARRERPHSRRQSGHPPRAHDG